METTTTTTAYGSVGDTTGSGMAGGTSASSQDLMNRVVQGAHEAVDRFAAKAQPAVEAMHGHADDLSLMQEEWLSRARDTVREHPLAAVGTAVLAGMLLAKLSR